MTTIRDVARVAQVAPSTVSFVLNRSHSVRPETRRRVEAAIESLGYTRQRIGRPQGERRQRHIAVVIGTKHCLPPVPEHQHSLASDVRPSNAKAENIMGRAIRSAVVDKGHHSHSFSGFRSVEQDLVFQEAIESGEIDGVILLMEHPEDGYLDWLLRHDVPLVVVNRKPSLDRRFSYVEMDNVGGSRQVAEHLLSKGHQKLAVVQSDSRYSYNLDRVAGFVHAVKIAGAPEPLVEAPGSWLQVQSVCRELMAEGVTGVFVTSDTLALDCLNWWQKQGVNVPGQLEVVGFDDSGTTTKTGLCPTSVGYDPDELGRAAMHALEQLCRRQGQLAHMSASVATRLMEHDTTR